MKPRVAHPSPETGSVPTARSSEANGPSPEAGSTIGDRFSRAARFHSILLGRGAHRVRRRLKRIRTPQAVRGFTRAIGNRWWPGTSAADAASPSGKRLRLPAAVSRLGSSSPAGKEGASTQNRSGRVLAWDFAVVTACVAILLVIHHQFKRPFRSLARGSIVAAAVEPAGDRPMKKASFARQGHTKRELRVTERPTDSATDSPLPPLQADPKAAVPLQGEPATGQNDPGALGTNQVKAKPDDWSSQAASVPAISSNAEPPQTAMTDSKPDQAKEASKSPATGDNSSATLADSPKNSDSAVLPTKRRRHHHPTDPAVPAAATSSPALGESTAGPSDSSPKSDPASSSDSAIPPLNAAAEKTPAAPGDSLTASKPTPDSAAAGPGLMISGDQAASKSDVPVASQVVAPSPTGTVKLDDSPAIGLDAAPPKDASSAPRPDPKLDKPAEKVTAGGDIFGALQDPTAEKKEVKGPEFGSSPAAENATGETVHRRRRKRKPADAVVSAPDSSHAPEQNPASGPLTDAKPKDPEKAADVANSNGSAPDPKLEKKTDDWSLSATSREATPVKGSSGEPKSDHPVEKSPTSTAERDAFGGLKVAPATKQDLPPKGPELVANGAAPTLDHPEPPKRRRRRKPPEIEAATPGAIHTAEQSPIGDPAGSTKPQEAAKPDVAAKTDTAKSEVTKTLETPKPVALEGPKTESKPNDVKPGEPKQAPTPAVAGPSLNAEFPAAIKEPRPEVVAIPHNVPTVIPPSTPAPASVPRAVPDDESLQANVSFARRMPEKTEAGHSLTYQIVVRNNGSKPVKLVQIDEGVPPEHTVLMTEPAAESHEQSLHWSLRDLGPHEERTIAITLALPVPPQPIVRTAGIPKSERAEDEPVRAAKTDETDKPHMELELIAPATLHTGEPCRIGFRVTNLGPKTSSLKLNLDLPVQLHFERGQQLQYKVGELDGHESREDYLTATATGPGLVEIRGSILLNGETLVAAKAVCRIAGVLTTHQAPRAKRDGMVVPAGGLEAASPTPTPCNCGAH